MISVISKNERNLFVEKTAELPEPISRSNLNRFKKKLYEVKKRKIFIHLEVMIKNMSFCTLQKSTYQLIEER